MTARPRSAAAVGAALALALSFAATAQDAMPAMPMSPTHHAPQHAHPPSLPSAQTAPAPPSTAAMPGMDMGATPAPPAPKTAPAIPSTAPMPGMAMGATPAPPAPKTAPATPSTAAMPGMNMGATPAPPRSADYSDGYGYGALPGMDMHDEQAHGALVLDQFEYAHWNAGHAVAIDGEAWYSRDRNKLWLNFEGEHTAGKLEDLRTEALWSHAITAYWNTQLGVRHDFGVGPGRTWAAFGIEGLAPYWFATAATFYVGQGGRTAARVEAEYALRFTQRWILQPKLEANFYGQNDPQRGVGSGLSELTAGLRLRYEIRREWAPYIGIVRVQRYGSAATFARAAGGAAGETRFVAGVRVWY